MAETSTTDLLRGATDGNQRCWDKLVDRFAPLVWSVIRGFRLGDAASADASQMVWYRLADNAHRIHDPERLGSWLATTARREALRLLKDRERLVPSDAFGDRADLSLAGTEERVEDAETLREALAALAQLSDDCRHLLRLCCATPALDYRAIAEILDRPVGSIGPTRARCLDRLRSLMPYAGGRSHD